MKNVMMSTRRVARRVAALGTFALGLAAPMTASALPDFRLTLLDEAVSGAFNVVAMSLENTSDAGESITGFSLTIGDTDWSFDYVRDISQAAPYLSFPTGVTGAALVTGDMEERGAATDIFELTFSNFDPGERLDLVVDLDGDCFLWFLCAVADAREVLFNNAGEPNAVISVQYDTGASVDVSMSDLDPAGEGFTFSTLTGAVTPIPEPSTALLVGLGLIGLFFSASRQRS